MTKWSGAVVLCLSWGCAAGGSVARTPDPSASRHLQEVRAARTALQERVRNAPAAYVASCKMTSDDCSLQVADSRARLVSTYRLDQCGDLPDADARSAWVITKLDGGGHVDELTQYIALDNWCVSKLVDCTSGLAEKARIAQVEQRFAERQQQLQQSPAGSTASNAVGAARAQVDYLRSTLPPDASAICPPEAERDACQQRVEAEAKRLDESLRQDAYDADAASARFEALKHLEASCQAPELACLTSALPNYGVFPESRKWVERNLALLAERQKLANQVDAEQGANCISGLQAEHQADIVAAYVPYVHEPVLYFRTQLDKAFLNLHQAQVGCLTAKQKRAPAHVVTAAR